MAHTKTRPGTKRSRNGAPRVAPKTGGKQPVLNAIAIANNVAARVWWSTTCKIKKCLGVAIYRQIISTGELTCLPAWIGWEDNPDWIPKTTADWPIQSIHWIDATFMEQKVPVRYKIVPMCGTAGKLTAREDLAVWTNPVQLDTACGPYVNCAFTRSVMASQGVLKALGMRGKSDILEEFKKAIDSDDPKVAFLANGIEDWVLAALDWAVAHGGKDYEARYEFNHPNTISRVIAAKKFVSLILGNAPFDDSTNKASRAQLKAALVNVIDRMLAREYTPHNKFGVATDANGVPQFVSAGKTNATATGYYCQWQNCITIEDQQVAQVFLDYWNRIVADDSQMGQAYRAANAQSTPMFTIKDGKTKIKIFCNPDMAGSTKPSKNAPEPPDFSFLRPYLEKATEIHGLFFEPGWPSFLLDILALAKNPKVFVRLAINGWDALPKGTKIIKRPGAAPIVVAASNIEKQIASWAPELGLQEGAHALIHSFVIVINPGDPENCIVITGSTNGGYHPCWQNDDIFTGVFGNPLCAWRYVCHVDDAFSHYTMRSAIASAQKGKKMKPSQRVSSNGFHLATDDTWQDKYVNPGPAHDEMLMWTSRTYPSFV